MAKDNLISQLKKLKAIKPFKGLPRRKSNEIWKRIQLKQAEDFYKKGLCNEAEYKRKIKEINLNYDSTKTREH